MVSDRNVPIFAFPDRDRREELLNSVTHAVGLILSIVGACVLAATPSQLSWSAALVCAWYALLLILLYAVSMLSHAVHAPRPKQLLRMWDQGLIYLFIAATYTPLIWIHVPGAARVVWLSIIWIAAVAGMLSKVLWQYRVNALATWGYLLLGWGPALGLVRYVQPGCLFWLVLGGLCYSIGVVFLKADHKYRYFHALWHVMVILGSSFHYIAILLYVVRVPYS